jgi:hypothetical protein
MTEKTRSEMGHTKVMTYAGTFAVLVFLLASACTTIAGFSGSELSICGLKFHDLNENGVLDKDELGLENWTFTLTNIGDCKIIDYATTDANGYFCFEDIPAGNYSIDEVLQEGWYNTTPAHQSIIIEDSSAMLFFGNAQEKEKWDKSSIEVVGECDSPNAVFTITNTGDPEDGDMQQPSQYRVYRNGVLEDTGSFQLQGGDSIEIVVAAHCDSIRLEADQSPNHPGNSHPNDVVDECGCKDDPPVILKLTTFNGDGDDDDGDDNGDDTGGDEGGDDGGDEKKLVIDDGDDDNETGEDTGDNETGDDDTGDGGEEEPPIEEPASPPTKKKPSEPIHINPMPIAMGDGPYQAQLGESITFNGSASKDDGSIIEWLWDFGDGTTASGEIVTHTYNQAKTYPVSLTVTDNYFKKSYPYKTIASIIQPNRSPEVPDILGPSDGIVNTGYSFVTISNDPDGDDLRYVFDWGDGETTSIPFAPEGYHVAGAHSWKEEGTYTITVSTSDGELSASAEKMIHIEAQTPAVDYAIVVGLAVLGAILLGLFIALMKRDHNK